MPFCRATSLVDPSDGVTPGFWLQLSTDAPGTWTGEAQTAWPQPVIGVDTLATYAVKVNSAYTTLCIRAFGPITTVVCKVNFTFTNLQPITLDGNNPPQVVEADCQLFKVV